MWHHAYVSSCIWIWCSCSKYWRRPKLRETKSGSKERGSCYIHSCWWRWRFAYLHSGTSWLRVLQSETLNSVSFNHACLSQAVHCLLWCQGQLRHFCLCLRVWNRDAAGSFTKELQTSCLLSRGVVNIICWHAESTITFRRPQKREMDWKFSSVLRWASEIRVVHVAIYCVVSEHITDVGIFSATRCGLKDSAKHYNIIPSTLSFYNWAEQEGNRHIGCRLRLCRNRIHIFLLLYSTVHHLYTPSHFKVSNSDMLLSGL